ncbi:hypothetical protein D9M71_594080 [compost metagenome]
MKLASRSAFISLAMRSRASSHSMRFHALEPGSRISGYLRRLGLWTKSKRPAPFGQRVPRLTGWSASPSIWMMFCATFFAASPWLYMIRPQPTEQYGQVLRVSMVRASLKCRTWSAKASGGATPRAARLDPPRPTAQTLKNCRRFMSIVFSLIRQALPSTWLRRYIQ